MVVNRFDFERRQQERDLTALERRYDPQGEPYRRYAQDKETIGRLLKAKVIDRPHADMLLERAKAKHDAVIDKLKDDTRLQRLHSKQMRWFFMALVVAAIAMVVSIKKLFSG